MPEDLRPVSPPLLADLRIAAVGDLMLGRSLEEAPFGSAEELLESAVLDLLQGDLVTGNLECLVTRSETRNPFSHAHFRTRPEFAGPLLRRFHVLSLANNHIYDFGDEGIDDTLTFLHGIEVFAVGVGRSAAEALAPAILVRRGRRIAVFGLATAVNLTAKGSRFTVAGPGPLAYRAIAEAARSGQFVVVHLHAGGGDIPYPAPEIRALHREIAAAGAHLILGHHPHCPQGWVANPRTVDFYSLGDFLFDRFEGGRDQALVVRIEVGETLALEVFPVVRAADFGIGFPGEEQRTELLDRLRALNQALQTGRSDRLYRQAAGPLARARLNSLLRDFKAGGPSAVFRRVRRAGPRRIAAFLHNLSSRLFHGSP